LCVIYATRFRNAYLVARVITILISHFGPTAKNFLRTLRVNKMPSKQNSKCTYHSGHFTLQLAPNTCYFFAHPKNSRIRVDFQHTETEEILRNVARQRVAKTHCAMCVTRLGLESVRAARIDLAPVREFHSVVGGFWRLGGKHLSHSLLSERVSK
jgi:hypothetical protein